MKSFQGLACFLCVTLLTGPATAQNEIRIDPAQGHLGGLTRPYEARSVPPINLSNSSRLEALVRAGNIYLSALDVVALALENNIDIETNRYNPLIALSNYVRSEAGGALPGVPSGVSQAGSVTIARAKAQR